MISGKVTDLLEATLSLTVFGPDDQTESIDAIIDTGFTGFLTLPNSAIKSLDLEWLCRQQGMLADGNLHTFDVYVGKIIWDGEVQEIEVEEAEIDPLLGMAMLNGHELTLQVRAGGDVNIERLNELPLLTTHVAAWSGPRRQVRGQLGHARFLMREPRHF